MIPRNVGDPSLLLKPWGHDAGWSGELQLGAQGKHARGADARGEDERYRGEVEEGWVAGQSALALADWDWKDTGTITIFPSSNF